MNPPTFVPDKSYGILQRGRVEGVVEEAVEQVRQLGFAVLDAGYGAADLKGFSDAFAEAQLRYVARYGENQLKSLGEIHTLRSLLVHGPDRFIELALNPILLDALKKLIAGRFILNQQNGVVNPPQETYNQGAWHRDLPYQHFVSSSPLAINALFCIDDFTAENGATFVLPASHKAEAFPSPQYVSKNAMQIEAKAGSFILLDCMVFHTGGFNCSLHVRRGVNHVYNIPYFKQQINLPMSLSPSATENLTPEIKGILGFDTQEPKSVEEYLAQRQAGKMGTN